MLLRHIPLLCALYKAFIFNHYKKIYSPQAQAVGTGIRKRKRASCSASLHSRGSATVEAALILPLFLCALCFLAMIGQLLLIEGEISHALSKTAMSCARQEAVKKVSGQNGEGGAVTGYITANAAFYSILQGDDLCKDCIVGGRQGILVNARTDAEEEKISVTARYILKVPVPFFEGARIARKLQTERRIYSGYLPHGRDGADGDNRLVYLTDHGSVYHTSLTCTHICLRISPNSLSLLALKARGIRPCEKCIKKGAQPGAYYITAEGDCYHSTLSCSGLKRSIRAVPRSEAGGIRPCSRCAKGGGK